MEEFEGEVRGVFEVNIEKNRKVFKEMLTRNFLLCYLKMKNEKAIVIGIVFALAMLAFVGCASAATIYVNPGESIQDAVNVASSRDTIIVRDSTYTENVNVNKRLTIKSENGAETTIVQAANPNDHVFEVTTDYVNISGFTVKGATKSNKAGVYLGSSSDHCIISTNNISNNYGIGILIEYGCPTIKNSTFKDNTIGISIRSGASPQIENNVFEENEKPICVYESYPSFSNNQAINNNLNGILVYGGSISQNTTWHADLPYIIDGVIIVSQDIVFTLKPGVLIKFYDSASGIIIDGTLKAIGGSVDDEKIIFTSYRDGEYGGSGNAAAGDWKQIYFSETSIDSELDNVVIRYGGEYYLPGTPCFWQRAAIRVEESPNFVLKNATIEHNKNKGLYLMNCPSTTLIDTVQFLENQVGCQGTLSTDDAIALSIEGGSPIIKNSVFNKNTIGIKITNSASPQIENNVFEESEKPIFVHDSYPCFSGNQAINNDINGILVFSTTISQDCVWKADLPYIVDGGLVIYQNVIFTLEPGVIIKFKTIVSGITVKGTLKAIGTADEKIIFTSNYNNPWPGSWQQIYFTETSTDSVLDNVVVKYGGEYSSSGVPCPWQRAAIRVEQTSIILKNSTIEHNKNKGLYLMNCPSNTLIHTVLFQENQQGCSTWSGTDDAIAISIQGGSPTIKNSVFDKNTIGIKITNSASPQIKDNIFTENEKPIYVYNSCPVFSNSQTPGNSNNINDIFVFSNDIRQNCVWKADLPYIVDGKIVVAQDVILTVEPGVIMKFYDVQSGIIVNGILNAIGTADEKIIFTSYRDDEYGGSGAWPGSWQQIYFSETSINSVLDNVFVKYGGRWPTYDPGCPPDRAAIRVKESSITLKNSIVDNNKNRGLYLIDCSSTTLIDNVLFSNHQVGCDDKYKPVIALLIEGGSPTIKNSTFKNNTFGIKIYGNLNNSHIYLNNFIDNTDNVVSTTSTNIWNSPGLITYIYNGNTYTNYLGNYWDDYTGSDADGDGIGSTPYSILPDSDSDIYPLMEPWENYFAPPENKPPTCAIELQKTGIPIDEINLGEFFDIYVGDSTDDQGIKEVRFSSDESQDGIPTGEWTEWYGWGTSSGDWNAANKIKAWSFATGGEKEVWAEVKDDAGQTDKDSANIYANPLPIAKPVITSPLEITPIKDIYYVGDNLNAEFTITNRGGEPVTFDVLVVGGRDSTGEVVDFDKKYNIALDSGDSYDYQGYLTLPDKMGIYHFFCAYQTPDGNWNTNIDVEIDGEIVEDFSEAKIYRERDIIVFEETYISPAPPPALWEKIDGPWDSWSTSLGNWNEAPQIAVNPNNPNEIYVEAIHRTNNWWENQGGKLYKSTNGGDSWNPINQGLPRLTWSEYYWPIRAIAIAPSNPDIIYVGTSTFNPYSDIIPFAKGVYKSVNGGLNWTPGGGPYTDKWPFKNYYSVSSMVVNPTNPDIVYVGTVGGGIWRTTNGGNTWEQIWDELVHKKTLLDVSDLAISSDNPNIIYAAAYNFDPLNAMGWSGVLIPNRLIKSEDSGNAWERLSLEILTAVPKIDDIVTDNKNADIVYVITEYFNLYKSTDGGQNWTDASGTAGTDPLPSPTPLGPTRGSSNSIAIHHDLSNVIYAAHLWEFCGVYFSPNSGENWFHIGLQEVCVKKIVFASNANYRLLYAAGIEGLFKLDLSEGLIEVTLRSPGELRVYDSQGRVTGLVNGEVKGEIPNSMYSEENRIVTMIFPTDSYRYEVVGTDEGLYGLGVTSVEDRETNTFTATDIPTMTGATHQYTIDWDALSQGEEGITVQVDSDGDGVFEQTFTDDNELTHGEFVLQTATTLDFDPDTLNLKSKGKVVTVYIELPVGYDVSQIEVSSIMLNGQVQAEAKPTEIGDYDDGGIPDLMIKFDRATVQSILEVGDEVELTVTGELTDGTSFEGRDTIRVIE